jgi:hypothetical protein
MDQIVSPPVRLCCGQRHYGVVCPDGKVMCCSCFERVTLGELSVDENGTRVDVCVPCDHLERSL